MDFLNYFNFSDIQWILIIVAAFMVGLSKTGVNGILMLVIPIMASAFGGRESTGVILPLLVAGDIFAVWFYHKHGNWRNIIRLLPWTMAGLVMGLVVGNYINDSQFKFLIGILVLACLIILLYTEIRKNGPAIPQSQWLSAVTGIAAGFATMIGNAAGPIFSVYLLAKGSKKYDFMGTAAWFFMIVNLTKVPLQIFIWHNVTVKSLLTMVLMLPAIGLGAFCGTVIIKKLNEKVFRYFILILTAIAAFRLLI